MHTKELSLFFAVVINADSATHTVEVAPLSPSDGQRKQGIVLTSVLCNSLGVKQTFIPPTGSRVLCVSVDGQRCIVVGVVPDEDESGNTLSTLNNRTSFGAGDTLKDKARHEGYGEQSTKITTHNNRRPIDVPTREYVLANDFGVLLGLFQQLATLKASELSQIQCFVFDDLVRIISHNFEHLTCMGEWRCSHDGNRLNIEAGLTHSVKEAAGMVDRPGVEPPSTFKEGKASHNDTTTVYSVDEHLKALERLKLFVGHLGDFVNLFLVLPANKQRKLNGEPLGAADKGLLQIKANLDGLLTIRSVKGVIIEKTNWIRVPTRVLREEDPNGNAETTDINTRDDFEFGDEYDDNGEPTFLYYLQLRDYLAYINEEYNYERFNTLDKDFVVPKDYNAEERLSAITFVDPTTGVAFRRKRSAFVLMPNGGVSLTDAWSSAINMEGGNIYLQPSNDLILQPGRNLIGKIGSHIQLAARREIDISSTEGGYRLKVDKSIYNYSDKSGIVLHSNGKLNSDDPLTPLDDAVEYVNGIVLKAPNSTLTSSAMYTYLKSAGSSIIDAPDNQLRSTTRIKLQSDSRVDLMADGLFLNAIQSLQLFSKGQATVIGDGSTIIGKKGQTFGIAKAGALSAPVEGFLDKEGKQADYFIELNDYIDKLLANTIELTIPGFNTQAKLDAVTFRFPSRDKLKSGDTWIPQTLAQQDEALQRGLYGLTPWVEAAINNTYPYPGADVAECFVTAAMNNVARNNDEFVNKTEQLLAKSTLNLPLNLFTEYTSK